MIELIDGSDIKSEINNTKNRKPKYTREEVLESIRRFYHKEGRVPKSEEFNKKDGYPGRYIVQKYFGSWNNAITEAGFAVNRMENLTDEELLEYLKKYEEEYVRSPRWEDLNNLKNNPNYPSMAQYISRWGNLDNARKLVGLDVDSQVRKGILNNPKQKARIAEIFVIEHFKEEGAVDLTGENYKCPVDGICPKKQIYDVKSSGWIDDHWSFHLNKKGQVDFYYLLAFNKDYSELKYVWRIPWNFTDISRLSIGLRDIPKMKKYEITEKFKEVFNKWKESLNEYNK